MARLKVVAITHCMAEEDLRHTCASAGASSVSPKLNTTRQQSSDSIFGDGDAEGQEAEQADLPAGKAQRPGSAVARQGSRLTDDTLQATVRCLQRLSCSIAWCICGQSLTMGSQLCLMAGSQPHTCGQSPSDDCT